MKGFVCAITAAVAVGACGSTIEPQPTGVAPRGTGPRYELGSLSPLTRSGRAVGDLRCLPGRRATHWVHVELFARGRVMLLPAGIGIAPPRRHGGAYVTGGRCRYPVWTDEPTGLVAGSGPARLGGPAAGWGRPPGPPALAGFPGAGRAPGAGPRWRGAPPPRPPRPPRPILRV